MYIITDADGKILASYNEEWERNEALMTGEFPDDAEPAYLNPGPAL